jgi:hypothetical protein
MRLSQGLILVVGVVSLGLGLLLIAMVWQFSVAVPSLPLAVLLLGVALMLIVLAWLLLRAKRGRRDP